MNVPFVVITGGAHAGKTTLVEALARRGFATLPEMAIEVIRELDRRVGPEEQVRWRLGHFAAFEREIVRRQVAQEEAHLRGGPVLPVFCDRGRHDAVAYCLDRGIPVPPEIGEACRAVRYAGVVVLDTVPGFDERPKTGRVGDHAESLRIRDLVERVYREHGHEPVSLPLMSLEDRVAAVLALVGRLGAG